LFEGVPADLINTLNGLAHRLTAARRSLRSSGMRRTLIPLSSLLALLCCGGVAGATPYVVYTANSETDGAVVLRTEPATGALVEISRNGSQGGLFETPFDLAIEADGNLVVADLGAPCTSGVEAPCPNDGRVIRVDPLSGRQTLVSSGGVLVDTAGIAVAPDGALYVVDNLAADNDGAVVRIDPRTGAQTVVSEGDRLDLPFGIALDRDGRLVVANRVSPGAVLGTCLASGRIVRVDPSTGAQTVVAESLLPLIDLIGWPLGLAIDRDGTIILANECSLLSTLTGGVGLVRVNPLGGLLSVLTPNSPADILQTPERIALAPSGDYLVSDFTAGDGDGGIVAVSASNGAQTLLRSDPLFNHPLGIAAVVNHPPTAALSVDPGLVAAGQAVRLDGSGSRDPDAQRLVYEWDLNGDGTFEAGSGTNPTASRTFTVDGTATVRVRVNDPHGGRAVAEARATVDGSMPVITGARTTAKVLAVGRRPPKRRRPPRSTSVRFGLSEQATVTVSVERARSGRRRSGVCRPRAKRGRRCLIWSRARRIVRSAQAGSNAIPVRAKGLSPGRFRLGLQAVDRVGNSSTRRTLPLRVVRLRN
jgi:sugar lactone lactonase YvrE